MGNLAAIDLGFLYTKGIINETPILFKSIVGEGKHLAFKDLDMGLNKEKDNIISRIETQEYFVSDLAIDQSDTIYHSLKANRFDSKATEVLIRTVFGLGFRGGVQDTYLVSGLPVSHYASFKNDIENLFMEHKMHNFDVVVGYHLNLNGWVNILEAKFIPQPFGALIHKLLDDNGEIADKQLAVKTIAIIDPGFGTTDVYVANSLSPVEKLTFSTQTAMNHAYRMISSKIEENFNVILPLHTIESIVQKGEFSKSGKTYSMSKVIQWAYKATAEQLIAEMMNKWKTLHEIDQIYLVGGGGIALAPYLIPEFPNIELIDDAQWSIVKGYYKWGIRSWKGQL